MKELFIYTGRDIDCIGIRLLIADPMVYLLNTPTNIHPIVVGVIDCMIIDCILEGLFIHHHQRGYAGRIIDCILIWLLVT